MCIRDSILSLNQKQLLKYPVLYLSGYIIRNKDDYYHNLQAVTERGAWKNWLTYILTGIEQTCTYTIHLIERITELYREMQHFVREHQPRISPDLITLLFFQPYIRAVHLADSALTKITTRQTATTRLNELVDLNMLTKKRVGRETVYINYQLMQLLAD